MRRRARERSVGLLAPFTAPEGDFLEVWEAWVEWDARMTAYELAHPGQEDECDRAREESVVPDAPFDPDDI